MLVYTQECYNTEGENIIMYLYCDNIVQGLYSIKIYIGEIRQYGTYRYIAESTLDAIQWAQAEMQERL